MYCLLEYYKTYKKYTSSKFKFGIVYIKEAHSIDEDPVDEGNYNLKQHQNIKNRFDSFKLTINEFSQFIDNEQDGHNGMDEILNNFSLLMDNMNDDILNSFNSYPDRFIVLHKNKLLFTSRYLPISQHLEVKKLDEFLSKL